MEGWGSTPWTPLALMGWGGGLWKCRFLLPWKPVVGPCWDRLVLLGPWKRQSLMMHPRDLKDVPQIPCGAFHAAS